MKEYFRPFNFPATDTVRKKAYDWFYLRETYSDKYEPSLATTVDPNDFFHVKIINFYKPTDKKMPFLAVRC